jgi:hypothetical protein
MKYFGLLRIDTIENLDSEEIMNFLINNQLFEEYVEAEVFFCEDFDSNTFDIKKQFDKSTNSFFPTLYEFMKLISIQLRENINQKLNKDKALRTDFNNFSINQGQNIALQPTQNLVDDFYQSFIEFHHEKIANIKFTFYLKYGEKIFGLNINVQKAIALKNYKKIYKIIFEDKTIYMPDEDSDEDSEDFETSKLKVENKLNMVYCQLLKYKYKISTLNPFFTYLTGDESIFTKTFYNKNQKTIDEALNYEALKEIMVELNNKFEFEEDFFVNKKEDAKSIEDLIPQTNKVDYKNKENNFKLGNSKNSPIPFIDFIRHENKIEIERIIKTHYSDLRGVSLRYLIEFLIDKQILLINYGDKTKIHKSLKILFNKDIGTSSSIFDLKIDREKDHKYLNAKNNFLIKFEKLF